MGGEKGRLKNGKIKNAEWLAEGEKKGYALSQIVRIQVARCSTTHALDVFFFVLLSNKHIGSSWDELMGLQLSQSFIIHRKVHLQTALLNVVLPAHTQGGKSQHRDTWYTCYSIPAHTVTIIGLSFNYTFTQTSLTTQLLFTSCPSHVSQQICPLHSISHLFYTVSLALFPDLPTIQFLIANRSKESILRRHSLLRTRRSMFFTS